MDAGDKCIFCEYPLNVLPVFKIDNKNSPNERICGRFTIAGNLKDLKIVKDESYETKIEKTDKFPCKNQQQGCKSSQTLNEIIEHEIFCPYENFQCPMVSIMDCNWSESFNKLIDHFKEKHKNFYIDVDNESNVLELNLKETTHQAFLCKHPDGIFLVLTKTDVEMDNLWFCVRHLDNYMNGTKYVYSLQLNMSSDYVFYNETIQSNLTCHITEIDSAVKGLKSLLDKYKIDVNRKVSSFFNITKQIINKTERQESKLVEQLEKTDSQNSYKLNEKFGEKSESMDYSQIERSGSLLMEKVENRRSLDYKRTERQGSTLTEKEHPGNMDYSQMERQGSTLKEKVNPGNMVYSQMERQGSSLEEKEKQNDPKHVLSKSHEKDCTAPPISNSTSTRQNSNQNDEKETSKLPQCRGCKRSLSINVLKKHEEMCALVKEKKCCWCSEDVPLISLKEHENTCALRTEVCQHCKESFLSEQASIHKDICPAKTNYLEEVKPAEKKAICRLCRKNFTIAELSVHIKTCSEKIVPCTICKEAVPFKDLYDHKKTCTPKTMKCYKCKEDIEISEFAIHSTNCLGRGLIKCQHCQNAVDKDQIMKHEGNCDYQEVTCRNIKCELKMRKIELEEHMNTKCKYRDQTKYKCKICGSYQGEMHKFINDHLRIAHKENFYDYYECHRTMSKSKEWMRWYMLVDGQLMKCKSHYWGDGALSFDARYEGPDPKLKKFSLRIKIEHNGTFVVKQQECKSSGNRYSGCLDIDSKEVSHLIFNEIVHFTCIIIDHNSDPRKAH